MFESLNLKRNWRIDFSFTALIVALYIVFRLGMPTVFSSEINLLFVSSLIFLTLGVLLYYLVLDMNFKLASTMRTGFFPISATVFFFAKMVPRISSEIGNGKLMLYFGIPYLGILFAYFAAHLWNYLEEPEAEGSSETAESAGED